MGYLDRGLRLLLAAGIGALYFLGLLPLGWALGLLAVAAVFVVTSLVGSCPLYLPFGFNTFFGRAPRLPRP